jgi:hypothetical protein
MTGKKHNSDTPQRASGDLHQRYHAWWDMGWLPERSGRKRLV